MIARLFARLQYFIFSYEGGKYYNVCYISAL